MANYRSLVIGGFFANPDIDKDLPVAIRFNNPGAVNGSAWERSYPGYVSEVETTTGNHSTIFETPEHGIAVWFELMRKYHDVGATTVEKIIRRYGGSNQDYSEYVEAVTNRTGFSPFKEIHLDGTPEHEPELIKFAKAMFRQEAGTKWPNSNRQIIPWSDDQIKYGFAFAREYARTGKIPVAPLATYPQVPASQQSTTATVIAGLVGYLWSWFGVKQPLLKYTRVLEKSSVGDDVKALQSRLHAIGYSDLIPDGIFGDVTKAAVKKFQLSRNLDPDGEVGEMTYAELNKSDAQVPRPPLLPPPAVTKNGVTLVKPPWYTLAERDIGFHEIGVNRGIERLIIASKTGTVKELLGQPYCAIGVNADLELSGIHGSGSAMARSFERSDNFVRLAEPALGAIVTNWRGSRESGQGHVFFYDGESSKGIRGIGYNEEDSVKRSFHPRARVTGYFWPKLYAMPTLSKILVNDDGSTVSGKET